MVGGSRVDREKSTEQVIVAVEQGYDVLSEADNEYVLTGQVTQGWADQSSQVEAKWIVYLHVALTVLWSGRLTESSAKSTWIERRTLMGLGGLHRYRQLSELQYNWQ